MQIRDLGKVDYSTTLREMRDFTEQRHAETDDELWLLEHHPVFTQGHNGRAEHMLTRSDIPLVQSDRGGQITYHGPGQLVIYTLLDLKRMHSGVRQMVTLLEDSVIRLLAHYNIRAYARKDAPGVYVNEAKIAALGLRVRRGACYHGISVNVDMDLRPFDLINPCGYAGMSVTDMKRLGVSLTMPQAKQQLSSLLVSAINQQASNTP